jgi:hypothetical protein
MPSVTKERGFKTGGVSRCYQCQAQLQRAKGHFKFLEVVALGGETVRIHHHCKADALRDGLKENK